jgi:hypothetical protein
LGLESPRIALYVARRWAWRRRGYVTLALAAAVGIVGAAFVAVRARMQAAEGSRVAQRLGRELERIETGLRVAYLLPEHDVDVDRRRLASDLDAVRALVDGASGESSASGRVVLARALLLLDDPVAARRELERGNPHRPDDAATSWRLGDGS